MLGTLTLPGYIVIIADDFQLSTGVNSITRFETFNTIMDTLFVGTLDVDTLYVVFLGKILYSHSASLHPGV